MINVFLKLLNISFSASLLIAACIVIRYVIKGMPKYMRCILWLLVLVRLACPIRLESPFSLLPHKDIISVSIAEPSDSVVSDVIVPEKVETEYYVNTEMTDSNLQSVKAVPYEEGKVYTHISKTDILTILSVIWILGIVVTIVCGIISYIRLLACVKDAVLLKANIYQSERVTTPFVLGFFRTRIYVPYNLTATELYFVLSHERAHISRKDHMLKPVAYVISCIYWFNPLVWISYSMLCRDIELACDEKAINKIGYNRKKEYSQSILDLSIPRKYISACPVAFGETGVKERVKSVLNMKKSTKIVTAVGAAIIVITGIGFLTYPKNNDQDNKEVAAAVEESTELKTEAVVADVTEETKQEDVTEAAESVVASVEIPADSDTEKDIITSINLEDVPDDIEADSPISISYRDITANHKVVYYTYALNGEGDEPVSLDVDDDGNIMVIRSTFNTETGEEDMVRLYLDSDSDSVYCYENVAVGSVEDAVDSDSVYVARSFSEEHKGTDIVAKEGSDVLSFVDGTVSDVGYNDNEGNFIEIKSEKGEVFRYGNLKELPQFKTGDTVKAKQVIGKVGNTGKSTGPHLHLTLKDKDGNDKDIEIYFADNPSKNKDEP